MRASSRVIIFSLTFISLLSSNLFTSRAQLRPNDWSGVEQAIGKAGTVQPDGVYKISLPRSDLHVRVRDVEIRPALALGSWLAFVRMGNDGDGRSCLDGR